MSTTQELRDYLKMTARPAQVEELELVLNDLEAAEKRIAAALETVRLGGDPNKALIAVRAILDAN